MNITLKNIHEIGVGYIDGKFIVNPNCPRRIEAVIDGDVSPGEKFFRSSEIIPYFYTLMAPQRYNEGKPMNKIMGEPAVGAERALAMADYLKSQGIYSPNGYCNSIASLWGDNPVISTPYIYDAETGILTNIWVIRDVHEKGGQPTTSLAGLLKLGMRCFEDKKYIDLTEMLLQTYLYPNVKAYHLHVVGLEKDNPHDQHLEYAWGIKPEHTEAAKKLIELTLRVYNKMKDEDFPKEETRYRCKYCPVLKCESNIKSNPLLYKKKWC